MFSCTTHINLHLSQQPLPICSSFQLRNLNAGGVAAGREMMNTGTKWHSSSLKKQTIWFHTELNLDSKVVLWEMYQVPSPEMTKVCQEGAGTETGGQGALASLLP